MSKRPLSLAPNVFSETLDDEKEILERLSPCGIWSDGLNLRESEGCPESIRSDLPASLSMRVTLDSLIGDPRGWLAVWGLNRASTEDLRLSMSEIASPPL